MGPAFRFATHLCILYLMLLGTCQAFKRLIFEEGKDGDLKRLPTSRFRAITVLHRPCSTLGYTLANIASNLGPEWPLLVLHNKEVTPSLERNKIVQLQKKHGILHTAALESNGFPTLSSSNSSSYSKLLASTRFWPMLKAEHVLLFQTDSVLCSMSPWTIGDFLQYDYIGAPWIDRWYGMDIGNGGLSLRKTKTMIRITKTFRFNETENEDIYFARGIYKLAERDRTIIIPPIHVAAKFAYEAGKLPQVTSFGVHKTPFREVDREAITATCPEALMGVWRGCQVDLYEETPTMTTTAARGEASKLMRADRRFFAADRLGENVVDFEYDYSISGRVPPLLRAG